MTWFPAGAIGAEPALAAVKDASVVFTSGDDSADAARIVVASMRRAVPESPGIDRPFICLAAAWACHRQV